MYPYRPNHHYHDFFANPTKGDGIDNSKLRQLETRIDKLEIITEAMWRLLQQKTNLTDNELLEAMCHVDLADGRLDGKKSTKTNVLKCPKCGRKNNHKHATCIYCGEILLHPPF